MTIEFVLSSAEDGTPLDWTEPGEPLTFLHGTGRVLPGFERALYGCEPGQLLEIEVPPEEAYGFHDPALIESVPRAQFGPGGPPDVGEHFEAQAGGRIRFAQVVGYEGDEVQLDLNHPLAGATLRIQAKVLHVRVATPAELASGKPIAGLAGNPGP